MIKFFTGRGASVALLAMLGFVPAVRGQSLAVFPRVSGEAAELSLFNPSDRAHPVRFFLRKLDGELAPAPANPVQYEVPARSHFAITAGELFGGPGNDVWDDGAWIGISGDPEIAGGLIDQTADGALESSVARALLDQLVVVPDRQRPRRIRLVNPGSESASVLVAVRAGSGALLGEISETIPPGGGFEFPLGPLAGNHRGVLAVRVSATRPVAAQATIMTPTSRVHINGTSATDGASTLRFAAHAPFLGGQASSLVLGNPTSEAIPVVVTLSSADGGPVLPSLALPSSRSVTIPPNGAVTLEARSITGLPFDATIDGIVRVDSPNVPMTAAFLIAQGDSLAAYPLSVDPLLRAYYPRRNGAPADSTGLALTNPGSAEALVEVWLLGARGESLARATVQLAPHSKRATLLTALFDSAAILRAYGIVVGSSVPVHSIVAEGVTAPDMAVLDPVATAWTGADPVPVPVLHTVEPLTVVPGSILRFRADNIDESTVLRFGDSDLPVRQLAPGISVLGVEVPNVEPGYLDVRLVSAGGFESDPVRVLVGSFGPGGVRAIEGRGFYEKIPVTTEGLVPAASYMLPMADVRVEVFNLATGAVFAAGVTGPAGRFAVPAPISDGYGVRVLASSPDRSLVVADNRAEGAVFSVGVPLDSAGQPPALVATDAAGVSGAFNIFHLLAYGNDFVSDLSGGGSVPPLVVFWSSSNSRATIGATFFDAASRTAYVLGDRSEDSDEYDDAVILHEYAHMLAEHFSRDDSSGGPHVRGDVLDPRVAWSEGWANFFSGLARDDALYVDTFGTNGSETVVFDLDQNLTAGDAGGYWSEFAIHSLLWDMADPAEAGDTDGVHIDVQTMWQAFEAMQAGQFVYLPVFLDRLVALVPEDETLIEDLARERSIDYEASDDPSVSNPFPRLISAAAPVTGVVDSKSRNRANLAQSAHLYAFDVTGGAVSVRLDITGLGPAANPSANDLDLFLLDATGRVLGRSDRGLNGQSELISTFLPAGRYVVEVRSYYFRAETGTPVYSSGEYRLTFSLP